MHDVNGNWIGYGLGDTGPQVTEIQHRVLKAYPKNSNAVALGVTESGVYDKATVQAVINLAVYINQTQGKNLRTDGVADYAVEVAFGAVTPPPPAKITYLSVNGTGVDMWTGFPADIGRALNPDKFYWQPVGYPSATFPMGPSVQEGVTELVRQLTDVHPTGPIVLCGYSQGALVVCTVWRDYILNSNGPLNHRLKDVLGVITFGNPMRAPGVANGNVYAGQPIPKPLDGAITGGIAGPGNLTPAQTPANFLDFAHDGDLYASAPVGPNPWVTQTDVGHDETLIFNIVQNFSFDNIIAIGEAVVQVLTDPWDQLIPLVEAIYNGGLFFAMGMSSPHYTYTTDAAIRWLNELAA